MKDDSGNMRRESVGLTLEWYIGIKVDIENILD